MRSVGIYQPSVFTIHESQARLECFLIQALSIKAFHSTVRFNDLINMLLGVLLQRKAYD